MKPLRIGRKYYLQARVPQRYRAVETSKFVKVSLQTDSRDVANTKLPQVWADFIRGWELRLQGRDEDAQTRFDAARELADRRGFDFLTMDRVQTLPVAELTARLNAISKSPSGVPDPVEAAALLGNVKRPVMMLDDVLAAYTKLVRPENKGKSEGQWKEYIGRKTTSINHFKAIVGDMPFTDIRRNHLMQYWEHWAERVNNGETSASNASHAMSYLKAVLNRVHKKDKTINPFLDFEDLSFKVKQNPYPPFSDQWITTRLLDPKNLMKLETQPRCLLLGMVNTGYRPVEGANLGKDGIRLEGPIPFISIAPVGRELKTESSERQIPLTGVSLEAFQQCPEGFTAFSDDRGFLSNIIGRWLEANNLRETPRHVMYSLRHSFEDRLTAINVNDRISADLMGHKYPRPSYGVGGRLGQLHQILTPIAI